MKKGKKLLAVLLVLAMSLGLAACSGFEMKMARAAKKMEKLQSYRMDLNVDMGLSMSMLGQSLDLDMGMQSAADVLQDPLRMRVETSISTMGESLEMLTYSEKTDDAFTTYVSLNDGKTWAKKNTDIGEKPEISGLQGFAMLFKLAGRFEKTGTEKVRGSEATVYAGTVEGEEIRALVDNTGYLDTLTESLDIDAEDLNLNLEECGGVPVTIAIDNKSGMISRYTMDLTGLAKQVMPPVMDQLMEKLAEESGLDSLGSLDLSMLGLKFEVTRVLCEVEFYDFDAVDAFEILSEAREAADLDDLAA